MRRLFLSCEHGGNDVPPPFDRYFRQAKKALASHRGWDPGALDLFTALQPLAVASYQASLSRLVIELNRSEHHPRLFSEYSRSFPEEWKQWLVQEVHRPYRAALLNDVEGAVAEGDEVLHIGVHSFTPELDGVQRTMDIGLLYDPSKPLEKRVAHQLAEAIKRRAPGLVLRMNAPYKGTSDGVAKWLRGTVTKGYAGIELEVNQRFARKGAMHPDIKLVLEAAVRASLLPEA